jgi:hypothetical protein
MGPLGGKDRVQSPPKWRGKAARTFSNILANKRVKSHPFIPPLPNSFWQSVSEALRWKEKKSSWVKVPFRSFTFFRIRSWRGALYLSAIHKTLPASTDSLLSQSSPHSILLSIPTKHHLISPSLPHSTLHHREPFHLHIPSQ